MQKDLKIGLFLGLVLAISALLWLATRPSLSPTARISGRPEAKNRFQSPSNTPYSAAAQEHFITPNEPAINEASTEVATRIEGDLPKGHIEARPSNHGIVASNIEIPSDNRQDTRVTPPDSVKYEQAEKIKPLKFHIVLKGQTLSSISYKYYGSAGKWKKIFDYNRNIIKDPNKLIPGTKLIIPE
jgi:nucleoid-associated protein YgaU